MLFILKLVSDFFIIHQEPSVELMSCALNKRIELYNVNVSQIEKVDFLK